MLPCRCRSTLSVLLQRCHSHMLSDCFATVMLLCYCHAALVSVVQLIFSQSRTDVFKAGVMIYFGHSGNTLRPFSAPLVYLAIHPPTSVPVFLQVRWPIVPTNCSFNSPCVMNGLCIWPHLLLLVWGVLVLHTIRGLPWCMTTGFAWDIYAVWDSVFWSNDNSPYNSVCCMRFCSWQWAFGLC